MSARDETICAVATPPGAGGLGIVRVSGPLVPDISIALLGRVPPSRYALLADFRAADGEVIDSGIALYFPAPHSFTGEHVLELQGHGGSHVLNADNEILSDDLKGSLEKEFFGEGVADLHRRSLGFRLFRDFLGGESRSMDAVSYTHLRAHETT